MRDNDPELLTNLAASLAQSDEQADLVLASEYVDRAARIADQTWPWWRPVRKEIEEARRRLGLSPLPPLRGVDHGWAMLEASLDEPRAHRIDAVMMLQRLSGFSYGVRLSQEWIETGEFTLRVEGRGNALVLQAADVTAIEIGLKQFEEAISGRLGLTALIERDMSALLQSPRSLYSDN